MSAKPLKKNLLGREKSPYLLQHKDNPVWWQAWGNEAFTLAKEEDKPVFLSIGYSTCHWCHVMEHESFEDQEVADYLNQHFISIKVDREELPDVDQVYMRVVQALTGHGGWPMTVLLNSERKPFFGGTYYPKNTLLQLLREIVGLWQRDRSKIDEVCQGIVGQLRSQPRLDSSNDLLSSDLLDLGLDAALEDFEPNFGGFGDAPKFPPAMRLRLLLRLNQIVDPQRSKLLRRVIDHTLTQMAQGGIYDHLGGGFARYSTDARWIVPHFEKMLYDNALLSQTYLEAYQLTGNELYRSVTEETLQYLLRDMQTVDGALCSAEDADSEGEEGKFYVWSIEELKAVLLEDEFEAFKEHYLISENPNFEGHSHVLTLRPGSDWGKKNQGILGKAQAKLFKLRESRVRPLRDDKVITAWNGLAISALAKAGMAFEDQRYIEAATNAASFIKNKLYAGTKLSRRYRDGEAKFEGLLDDYVFLIRGLIDLYQCTSDESWLRWAEKLQTTQDQIFWDNSEGGYKYSNSELILELKGYIDGAEPNPNGMAALNLFHLSQYFLKPEYRERALRILNLSAPLVQRYPHGFSTVLIAVDYWLHGGREMVLIAGKVGAKDPNYLRLRSRIRSGLLSRGVVAYPGNSEIPLLSQKSSVDGEITLYLCERGICHEPLRGWEAAERAINDLMLPHV